MSSSCGVIVLSAFLWSVESKIQILGDHIGKIVDSFCAQKQRRNAAS